LELSIRLDQNSFARRDVIISFVERPERKPWPFRSSESGSLFRHHFAGDFGVSVSRITRVGEHRVIGAGMPIFVTSVFRSSLGVLGGVFGLLLGSSLSVLGSFLGVLGSAFGLLLRS